MRKFLEGFDFTVPSHTFEAQDFAGMADALGIGSLKQEYRDVLQGECFRFLALVASWEQAPRPAGIRKHLKKVHSDTVRMMKTIHALHDADASDRPARQAAMVLLHISAPDNDWAAQDTDLFEFSGRLATLGKAANDAICSFQDDPGGISGDFPLEELVHRLGPIFTQITDRRPTITYNNHKEPENAYQGRFLIFVEAFLQPLSSQYPKTRSALGASVKRILSRD